MYDDVEEGYRKDAEIYMGLGEQLEEPTNTPYNSLLFKKVAYGGDDYISLLYSEIAPKIENDKTFVEFVKYAPQYEVYGDNLENAVRTFDKQRIVPDIGIYSMEEKKMMMVMARFIANRDGPVVNVPNKKLGGAHDIHYVRD